MMDDFKAEAIAQIDGVAELFSQIDDIKEAARQKRLALEKLVKAQKQAIKDALIAEAKAAASAAGVADGRDFAADIKGLKTLPSIKNALSTAIAQEKVGAEIAKNRDMPDITLTEIGRRLGLRVAADFVELMGFEMKVRGAGKVLAGADFGRLCDAIAAHAVKTKGEWA